MCFEIVLVVNVPENTDFLKKYQNLKIITVYNQEIKGFEKITIMPLQKAMVNFLSF